MYSNFCCPKCDSFMFGSYCNEDGTWTRRCHGNEQQICKFEFPESDDKLYFKEWLEPEAGEAQVFRYYY